MQTQEDASVRVGGISTAEAAKYNSLFKLIASNNGSEGDTITERDLADIMPRMGVFLSEDELHKLFSQIDVDGSGDIDFNEFLLLIARHREASQLALLQGGRDSFEMLKSSTNLHHVWRTDSAFNAAFDVVVAGLILYYFLTVLYEDVRQDDIAQAIYFKSIAGALMLFDIYRHSRTGVSVSEELVDDCAATARSQYAGSARSRIDLLAGLPFDVILHVVGLKHVMRGLQHLRLLKFFTMPTMFRRSTSELVTPAYARWHFFLLPLLKMVFLAILIFHALTLIWIVLVEHDTHGHDYMPPHPPGTAEGGSGAQYPNTTVSAVLNTTMSIAFNYTDTSTSTSGAVSAAPNAPRGGGGNVTVTANDGGGAHVITYVDALYFVVFTLTTCGYTGEHVHTNGQRVYCVFLFCCASVVTGLVVGKLVQFSQQADLQSDAHRLMLETLAALNHLAIPKEFKMEVLGFQLHRLKHSNSLFDTSIADLPQCMRDRMTLYAHMKIVRQVPIFAEASDICVAKLAQSLNTIFAPPEEYIVIAGEEGEEMFFLFHGMCCVTLANGKWVATIKRGGVFGEVALLEATRRSASIKSLTYCQLFRLDKASFEQIVEVFPDLLEAIKSVSVALRARIEANDTKGGGSEAPGGIETPPSMSETGSNGAPGAGEGATEDFPKRNRYAELCAGLSRMDTSSENRLDGRYSMLPLSAATSAVSASILRDEANEQPVPMPHTTVESSPAVQSIFPDASRRGSAARSFGLLDSPQVLLPLRPASSGRLTGRRGSAAASSAGSLVRTVSNLSISPIIRARGLKVRPRVSTSDAYQPPFSPTKMEALDGKLDRILHLLDLVSTGDDGTFCNSIIGLADQETEKVR